MLAHPDAAELQINQMLRDVVLAGRAKFVHFMKMLRLHKKAEKRSPGWTLNRPLLLLRGSPGWTLNRPLLLLVRAGQ